VEAAWASPDGRVAVVRSFHTPPRFLVLQTGAGGWLKDSDHATLRAAIKAGRRVARVAQAPVGRDPVRADLIRLAKETTTRALRILDRAQTLGGHRTANQQYELDTRAARALRFAADRWARVGGTTAARERAALERLADRTDPRRVGGGKR